MTVNQLCWILTFILYVLWGLSCYLLWLLQKKYAAEIAKFVEERYKQNRLNAAEVLVLLKKNEVLTRKLLAQNPGMRA